MQYTCAIWYFTCAVWLLFYYFTIVKNVIVEPKGLDVDDFDSMEEFNEVVTFGREVMQGKFRDKANASADKK